MSRWSDLLKGAREGASASWPLDAVPRAGELGPGMVVGEQYLIQAVLGEGGFGRVFLCANWQGKLCAVKTLRPDRACDPATVAMMRAEVQRWVELGVHPHLVTAFGMMEHARLPCVVMEYLHEARDLAQIIRRGGAHWTIALNAGAQVAAALEHAHRRSGLVHRDIKPENVLVIGNDWAKLSDFGISVARLTEADSLGHLQIGTAPYMAPELWGDSPRYSAQSDLYALGVTLYEAATGRHPLGAARSFADYGRLHLSAVPLSPLREDPTMPPAFAAFLLQCLDKDPARRPADAAEARLRLAELARVVLGASPLRAADEVAIDEADTWVDRSTLYHQLGLASEALDCARHALARAPDAPAALVALGNACQLAGRNAEARAALAKAAAASPDNVPALAGLARALLAADDRAGATDAIEKALAYLTTRDSVAQLDRVSGLVAELLGPARALAICDQVVTQLPHAALTWNNRATVLRRLRRPGEALESSRRALELNPVYPQAWVNLANASLELARPADALIAAAKAIELDPLLPGAYAALYAARMELQDIAGAEAALDEGLAALPDDALLARNSELLAAYKRERGAGRAAAPTALDDGAIQTLAEEIAFAVRAMWHERFQQFGARDADRAAHAARSRAVGERIHAAGLDLQRRGGLAAMHGLLKALKRIDNRCADLVEDSWKKEIAGYRPLKFLP